MLRYRQRFSMALLAASLALLLHWQNWASPLENVTYDTAVKWFPAPVGDDIVIVAIDEKTLLELGQWPFARKHHAGLLQQLAAMEPAAIGLDILFAERSLNSVDDELLIDQVASSSSVVLPVYIEFIENNNHYLEVLPIAELAITAAALGHVQAAVDSDGKSRGVYLLHRLDSSEQMHFSVAIEQLISGAPLPLPGLADQQVSGEFSRFVQSHKNYIPLAGGAGTFTTVSYSDVLHGRI
ncbi:MAG: CHASE2 domain-containing protein, partial [Porticoccaceae bacterium]|nr:CHASE2 domain-containing protein [Porticoccaceae bacterium]